MKKLQHERQEKAALENWAATKIQACFRGYRSRPHAVSYATRQKINTLSSIRAEVLDSRPRSRLMMPTQLLLWWFGCEHLAGRNARQLESG